MSAHFQIGSNSIFWKLNWWNFEYKSSCFGKGPMYHLLVGILKTWPNISTFNKSFYNFNFGGVTGHLPIVYFLNPIRLHDSVFFSISELMPNASYMAPNVILDIMRYIHSMQYIDTSMHNMGCTTNLNLNCSSVEFKFVAQF